MVCSRGESLTTHRNQMKLFNVLTISLVAATGMTMTAMEPVIASRLMDLDKGVQVDTNDLDNGFFLKKNGKIVKCPHAKDYDLGMPLKGQAVNAVEVTKLTPSEVVEYEYDFKTTQLPAFHPQRVWSGYCGSY